MSDDPQDSDDRPDEASDADRDEDYDPVEESDRFTRHTPTREEWIEMLNRADPWDQNLRAQKEFEQTEPRAEAIKAYRQEFRYYLLHRGEAAIDRLRYLAHDVDVNLRRTERTTLYELRDLPPQSYVEVGRIDLGGQRRMIFDLVSVEWADGRVHEEERRLRIFDHSDRVPSLEAMGLSLVEQEPRMVPEDDESTETNS